MLLLLLPGAEASAALKAVMEVLDMSGQDEQEPPEVRRKGKGSAAAAGAANDCAAESMLTTALATAFDTSIQTYVPVLLLLHYESFSWLA
jgi:hypothetical protein